MSQLLQLLGTFFISGSVILIVLALNFRYTSTVSGLVQSTAGVRSVSDIAQIFETDIYRTGYRVSGNKILQADSKALRFCSDIDNSGSIDTVYYYSGSASSLATANPNDKELFRKINSQTAVSVAYLRSYKFTYSDSTGAGISYASLSSQTNRNRIEYITVYLKLESADSIAANYSPIEWKKKIRPKNL